MCGIFSNRVFRCRVLSPSSEVTKSNGITCIVWGSLEPPWSTHEEGSQAFDFHWLTYGFWEQHYLHLQGTPIQTPSIFYQLTKKRISIKFLHASLAFVIPLSHIFLASSTQTIPPPTILLYFHVFCVPESLPHLRPLSFPPLTGPPTLRPPWTLQLKHVNLS